MGFGALSCERLGALMNRDTHDNFMAVMQNFEWPEPAPVFYRLYHDDQGRPLFYSMEDLPGTYIEVDQPTYVLSRTDVRVRNGKLIFLANRVCLNKLKPDLEMGTACHRSDVCVVVDSGAPHQKWKIATNETD